MDRLPYAIACKRGAVIKTANFQHAEIPVKISPEIFKLETKMKLLPSNLKNFYHQQELQISFRIFDDAVGIVTEDGGINQARWLGCLEISLQDIVLYHVKDEAVVSI